MTVTISAPHLLRKYNELRAQGYVTLWSGEGRICLRPPATGEVTVRPGVITEVRK